MAIALPIIVDNKKLVGTCFIAGRYENKLLFMTTLHQLGKGNNFCIAIPSHEGDMRKVQKYPIDSVKTQKVKLIYSNLILDLAVFISEISMEAYIPPFAGSLKDLFVGEDVIVAGYPFVGMGSVLEIANICNISSICQRLFMGNYPVDEFTVSNQTFTGSSGSPVIKRSNGNICGIVRGCLAPPELINVGNMPLGTDSNITYVLSSKYFNEVLDEAIKGV